MSPKNTMTFGQALVCLKSGIKVQRLGWNGVGMYLHLQRPDELSKMQRPYIYISTADCKLVPWVASQSDILEEDWCYVEVVERVS